MDLIEREGDELMWVVFLVCRTSMVRLRALQDEFVGSQPSQGPEGCRGMLSPMRTRIFKWWDYGCCNGESSSKKKHNTGMLGDIRSTVDFSRISGF
jgi:hypothetical protein